MKFNPDCHISVVRNFRQFWSEQKINSPLMLTDEQIWNLYEAYGAIEAPPEVYPNVLNRYDATVIEVMVEENTQCMAQGE